MREHKLLKQKNKLSIIEINACQRSIFCGITESGDHLGHSYAYEIHQFLATGFGDLVLAFRDLLVQFIPISALDMFQLSINDYPEVFNEPQVW